MTPLRRKKTRSTSTTPLPPRRTFARKLKRKKLKNNLIPKLVFLTTNLIDVYLVVALIATHCTEEKASSRLCADVGVLHGLIESATRNYVTCHRKCSLAYLISGSRKCCGVFFLQLTHHYSCIQIYVIVPACYFLLCRNLRLSSIRNNRIPCLTPLGSKR